MKVLVIGASGLTGKILVELLLARGDEVTAFARDPASIATKHARLRIAQGDAADRASLDRALAGQDAVLCAFGPRGIGKTSVQETLATNLLPAMKAAGVKRVVNLSAWGLGPERKSLLFRILLATMLRNIYADKARGEALLLASDLDYVNVRPGRLTNAAARGGVGASETGAGLTDWLTRADLAAFMVGQLEATTWVRKSVPIGYGTPS
jgi:uncharacterized protein YbjT (DUF2867 family)